MHGVTMKLLAIEIDFFEKEKYWLK